MVSITLVLLPLVTLLVMQLKFLAYQNELITWSQRVAIWADIFLIAYLWPVILHPKDDWRAYWRDLITAYVPKRRVWLSFLLLLAGVILVLFGADEKLFYSGIVVLLISALSLIPLRGWKITSHTHKILVGVIILGAILLVVISIMIHIDNHVFFLLSLLLIILAVLWQPKAPRGGFALLLILLAGSLLPLSLLVVGEGLERLVIRSQKSPAQQTLFSKFVGDKRWLDLDEQILLAKPPKPETLAMIRSGEWKNALKQIEPINLKDRHLRNALLYNVILTGADLRGARLQGAKLYGANLQGAKLYGANLQGAYLYGTNLQNAYLIEANLQGAYLYGAQLQGAYLSVANLQGAYLSWANLQGAYLLGARLQGAYLYGANLQSAYLSGANLQGTYLEFAHFQGANLSGANLQGAKLYGANLQGANLRFANLYATDLEKANTSLIDARYLKWEALKEVDTNQLITELNEVVIKDPKYLQRVQANLKRATQPDAPILYMQSCLAAKTTPVECEKRYDSEKPEELEDFNEKQNAYLAQLSCESHEVALGIISILNGAKSSDSSELSRESLAAKLKQSLDDKNCEGLQLLNVEEKKKMESLIQSIMGKSKTLPETPKF